MKAPKVGSNTADGPKIFANAVGIIHMETKLPIIAANKASTGLSNNAIRGTIIKFNVSMDGPPMNGEIGINVQITYIAEREAIKDILLTDGLKFSL